MRELREFCAERHFLLWSAQDDLAAAVMKPGDQTLGLNRTDLLRGKIDDADQQFSYEVVRLIEMGDLCARLLHADLRTEVDQQNVGGLARLRERLGTDDPPYTQFDL